MDEKQKLALSEEDFYGDHETKEEGVLLVVFRISNEWYAVDIASVREVVNFEKISFLPSCPEHIAGIFNLRGNIISVTDLKRIFNLSYEDITDKSMLVVIKSGIFETGLLVDEVAEPQEIPFSQINPTLATIAEDRASYLSGVCHIGKKLVGILKSEQILKVLERN
ncbi:MAG: purine-binding chemotaxis protein CheW [Candidatus Omnitrophica bacterium]|nr:purine-binding chemotaxis protein CheW [Candidatus Omnitrophota bacterium]